MAGRGSAWRVSDTQPPYPTLSELVRWTADQVGKTSRSAAEQAPGVPARQLQACCLAGSLPYGRNWHTR
jgi:hypothetical protein